MQMYSMCQHSSTPKRRGKAYCCARLRLLESSTAGSMYGNTCLQLFVQCALHCGTLFCVSESESQKWCDT